MSHTLPATKAGYDEVQLPYALVTCLSRFLARATHLTLHNERRFIDPLELSSGKRVRETPSRLFPNVCTRLLCVPVHKRDAFSESSAAFI